MNLEYTIKKQNDIIDYIEKTLSNKRLAKDKTKLIAIEARILEYRLFEEQKEKKNV